MIRFLLGAACGAIGAYWYLTGELPWDDGSFRWLTDAATSWSDRGGQ